MPRDAAGRGPGRETGSAGEPIVGDTLLALMNAHHEPIGFKLPATNEDHRWERLYDTADDGLDHAASPAGRCTAQGPVGCVVRTVPVEQPEPRITPLQAEAIRKRSTGPARR